ncbi:MAG: inorganic pyrophosphatase [Clostridiales bacterium]|jgi:inorganic pyrophosphatase|nr:inorganic pyrophosphatase [Clostridiales bacterium]MDN5283291.1 inorganic pyrophosphatase [Candidatus Ozemobacter sp.]
MTFPKPFYRWRPHPWHGLEVGVNPPVYVQAYIEITPFDLVKYEIDKETGYMRVDRPQRTSSQPPAMYGFIPRTYCGPRVCALSKGAKKGDGDPLDICVISERPIARAEVILNTRILGGLPMIDHGEADDKIIAVLDTDNMWQGVNDISELPPVLVERIYHYFSTYKLVPGQEVEIHIDSPYGREHAEKVISAAMLDYQDQFGN